MKKPKAPTKRDLKVSALVKILKARSAGSYNFKKVMTSFRRLATEDKVHGYHDTKIFRAMRDSNGKNDAKLRKFWAESFAEMRPWVPQALAIFLTEIYDHPLAWVLAENMASEYGQELGVSTVGPSHSILFLPVLQKLNVRIKGDTMATPLNPKSQAAKKFHETFLKKIRNESIAFRFGYLGAYEETGDLPDFRLYRVAVHRMFPGKRSFDRFFDIHAESNHGDKFAKNLQQLFQKERTEMMRGMCALLIDSKKYFIDSGEEIGL